jgi:hypothetical protein
METTERDLFVLNGLQGESVDRLAEFDHDPGVLRPFRWKDRNWVTISNGRDDNGEPLTKTILTNAVATLTPDQWELIDSTLIPVARQRLQFVSRVEAAGLRRVVPNGMATPVLTYQMISDSGQAQLNMDAVVDAQSDRPHTEPVSMPLPIAQAQFHFTTREVAVSRRAGRGGSFPLDLSQATNSARKIGELTERLFIGTGDTYTYGGGTVYGLINFPYRSTRTLTNPTTGGWTPHVLVSEVIAMIKQANDNGFYGPFEVFYSPNWMEVMENDFSTAKGSDTTIERLSRIKSISQLTQLDYLDRAYYDLVLVQMSSDTVQSVDGMPLTPLQWDSHGGLRKEYKMMQIKVPQFYRNFNGTCGIVHGSVAE